MKIKYLLLSKESFLFLAFIICTIFFALYGTLGIVRHLYYQSYGFDLGINDQVVWRYSHFQLPLTTIDPFPDKTKLAEHVELVYALISPFYWIWSNRRMLILVQAAFVCFSGLSVYLLARKRKLNQPISFALLISYLTFYGVQFALWTDVHSASFAAAFLLWFVYFLDSDNMVGTMTFFILAITAKENIGLLTFLISIVYFFKRRRKWHLYIIFGSIFYVAFIFLIFFPYIMHVQYLYSTNTSLASYFNIFRMFDSQDKISVYLYSFLSFGFLPLASVSALLPILGDLASYFVGTNLEGAMGLFGQYRITLAPFLVLGTILIISRYKKLNSGYIAIYLLVCAAFVQYNLHLPLSYLTKQWFWTEPSGVKSINQIIRQYLPKDASVAAQNNITPHISQREQIYTLYPTTKTFMSNSPCGKQQCNWFTWYDNPKFLIVDTSPEWDARHLLANRAEFIDGLKNLEKEKIITAGKRIGSTTLYRVLQNP